MLLKSALIAVILSSCSCASLPEFPEVVRYGVHGDVNPPGFYGVNNKTKERVYRDFLDKKMKGAQCLDNKDSKEVEAWLKAVEDIAAKKCH